MREIVEEAGAGQPPGIPPMYPVAASQVRTRAYAMRCLSFRVYA